MRLDSGLNGGADSYARELFRKYKGRGLAHSSRKSRPGIGENLAVGCTTARGVEGRTVQDAIKSWCVKLSYLGLAPIVQRDYVCMPLYPLGKSLSSDKTVSAPTNIFYSLVSDLSAG